ncbi:transcription factor TT8-like [Hibiscus syriacus]|uniref:Transcription factor TT8-like n=1 Tax=Hibiscus syriacus TaxID=106335 RepID=A0A6A2ZPP7_HIBSY|nr:transcription factor TT8-like [Hibiscus syriacus]
MDGQPGHENSHMSLNSGRNVDDFSYSYVDDTNPVLLTETGRNTNRPSLQSLSQWIECPKMPHSYVEFLTENLEEVPTADVLESIGSPVGGIHAVDGISEIQRKAFSSGPDAFSLEPEHGNLKLSASSTEINNHEASASEIFLRQRDRLSVNKFSSAEYAFHAQQNHAFRMQEPKEDDYNVYHLQSKGTFDAPSFWSKPQYRVPKPRAPANDRQRKIRIAEGIKALQELLPNSSELMSFSENVGRTPIIVAELKAIKKGIDVFVSSEWASKGRLIVESDCKLAVEWLKDQATVPSFLSNLVKEIASTISVYEIFVRWIPRCCNCEADKLVKEGIGTVFKSYVILLRAIKSGTLFLLPLVGSYPTRGQANALDDVIDYVKFLQLQIKELSLSRLGGEPTSNPLVFFEGYGHYVLHEQMINEPLEEMMGKLLEINPSAASQLLESRGLHMMPRALIDGLNRSS